jgi:hypothetical protein
VTIFEEFMAYLTTLPAAQTMQRESPVCVKAFLEDRISE